MKKVPAQYFSAPTDGDGRPLAFRLNVGWEVVDTLLAERGLAVTRLHRRLVIDQLKHSTPEYLSRAVQQVARQIENDN